MKDGIVPQFARAVVAMGFIAGTMPMIFPFGRAFLEDASAFRTEGIVAKTKVFVQEKGALRHPLMAVLALRIVWSMRASIIHQPAGRL
jgi:hypothetical protein